jgi:rhodanese-related sulfurtransferase
MNPIEFFRTSLKETFFILLISLVAAVVVNMLRSDPLVVFGSGTTSGTTETAPAPDELETGIAPISIEAAIARFENDAATFVDARMPVDYAAGHIEGAVNLPDYRFDEMIGPFLEAIPPDRPIITYCDGIDCPLSKDLAEKLVLMGFENVYHLLEGWSKWRAQGLPVERAE